VHCKRYTLSLCYHRAAGHAIPPQTTSHETRVFPLALTIRWFALGERKLNSSAVWFTWTNQWARCMGWSARSVHVQCNERLCTYRTDQSVSRSHRESSRRAGGRATINRKDFVSPDPRWSRYSGIRTCMSGPGCRAKRAQARAGYVKVRVWYRSLDCYKLYMRVCFSLDSLTRCRQFAARHTNQSAIKLLYREGPAISSLHWHVACPASHGPNLHRPCLGRPRYTYGQGRTLMHFHTW